MTRIRFSQGFHLDPIAKGSPEALVVILPDRRTSTAPLEPVATRWAMAVPTTAFIALDTIEQLEPDSHRASNAVLDGDTESALFDQVSRIVEPVLLSQLQTLRVDVSRMVLVGFGYGGTLALHMVLHEAFNCAGILAFAATLMRPLPRIVGNAPKVRLIGCAGDAGRSSLRDDMALLTARGVDTRGVLLSGSVLSQEAIRHGGAYLVELVATAQRGGRYRAERSVPGAHRAANGSDRRQA